MNLGKLTAKEQQVSNIIRIFAAEDCENIKRKGYGTKNDAKLSPVEYSSAIRANEDLRAG